MKRNSFSVVWKRCQICGTVFYDRLELQAHLAAHRALRPIISKDADGKTADVNSTPGTPRRNAKAVMGQAPDEER